MLDGPNSLNDWAQRHLCGPALSPDGWLQAARAARDTLTANGVVMFSERTGDGIDVAARAVAEAMKAVWPELRRLAREPR
jgi:hypothetical protein